MKRRAILLFAFLSTSCLYAMHESEIAESLPVADCTAPTSPVFVEVDLYKLAKIDIDIFEFAIPYSNIASTVIQKSATAQRIVEENQNRWHQMPGNLSIKAAKAFLRDRRGEKNCLREGIWKQMLEDPFVQALLNAVPKKIKLKKGWMAEYIAEDNVIVLDKIKNTILDTLLAIEINSVPALKNSDDEPKSFQGFYALIPLEAILKKAPKPVAEKLFSRVDIVKEVLSRSEIAREIKAEYEKDHEEFKNLCLELSLIESTKKCHCRAGALLEDVKDHWYTLQYQPFIASWVNALEEREVEKDDLSRVHDERKAVAGRKKERKKLMRTLIVYPLLGLDPHYKFEKKSGTRTMTRVDPSLF